MEYYPITNGNASASLASILAYDLEYIKTHPNVNLTWGNSTGNLSPKFYQFDELYSLPLIGELMSAGHELSKVVLSTINAGSTKIIQNSDYINVDKIHNASIIIPMDSEGTANYTWYDPNYITQDNIKSLPMLRKEHGSKIVEESCTIGKGVPVLVKHQCHWAAVSNKENRGFDFLQIVLSNDPTYDELKIILERTQVTNQSLGQDHNVF